MKEPIDMDFDDADFIIDCYDGAMGDGDAEVLRRVVAFARRARAAEKDEGAERTEGSDSR